ncbi:MAG: hypothetical protein WD048_07260, partial [Chitinophagales bacterium]
MKRFILITLYSIIILSVNAANRTWIAPANGDWNVAANWSGGAVPVAGDDVFFDGSSTFDCDINTNVNVNSISVANTYTGTISQYNFTIDVAGAMTFSGGTFIGGTANISCGGTFTLDGTNFTSTTQRLLVSGVGSNFVFTAPATFAANTGTVVLENNKTISGNSITFYNLEFRNGTFDFSGNTHVVNNNINYEVSAPVILNNGTLQLHGDLNINNPSGAGTGGTATIEFVGAADQNVNSSVALGQGKTPNITINKAGGDLVINGNFTVMGTWNFLTPTTVGGNGKLILFNGNTISGVAHTVPNLVFQQGDYEISTDITVSDTLWLRGTNTIRINTGDIFLTGNLKIDNTNNAGGGTGTVHIVGGADKVCISSVSCGKGKLPNVVFDKPASSFTVIQTTANAGFSIEGTWTYVDGTFLGNGFVCFSNANTISGPSQNFKNVGFSRGDYNINSPVNVADTLLITGGNAVRFVNGDISLQGNLLINNASGAVTCYTSGNIILDGTADQSIIGNSVSGQGKLPNIIINKASGTLNLLGTGVITVAGDWILQNGTVDAGTSTVVFYCDRNLDMTGAATESFYNITLGDGSMRTLTGNTNVSNQIDLATGVINLNARDLNFTNPNSLALLRTTGTLQSETGPVPGYGRFIWDVRNSAAGTNYLIPFRNAGGNNIPVEYRIQTAGVETGIGKVAFATYPTDPNGGPPNNRPLPTGVSNLDDYFNVENAANVIDRYWIIEPINYTTPPVAQLLLSYRDSEWNTGNNTINENELKVQRWEDPYWDVPYPTTIDAAANTATTDVGVDQYSIFTLSTAVIPEVDFSGPDLVCLNDCVDFADSTSPTGVDSWLWSFPGATPSSSTDQNPTGICYNSTGDYDVSLTVTYPSGATASDTKTDFITVNPLPTTTAGPDTTLCEGAAAELFATGGVEYAWSPNININDTTLANPTIFPTADREYVVQVTDANACIAYDTVNITVFSSSIDLTLGVLDSVSCTGETDAALEAVVIGGNLPLTYTWSNNLRIKANTNDDRDTLENIGAGTYWVRVNDDIGCAKTDTVTLIEPDTLTATATLDNAISCFDADDAQISISASGGTGTLEYSIDSGATFQLDSVFTGISSGSYIATVRDANECTATVSGTIEITNPPELTIAAVLDSNISCHNANDAQISATASGGSGDLEFSIDSGATYQVDTFFSNLSAGDYTIIVRDTSGCTDTSSVVTITNPDSLSIEIFARDITCNGENNGSVWVDVTGGTTPYQYNWNNAAITDSIFNLSPGTYCVTVTDDNGCQISACDTIIEPTALTASITDSSHITCNGADDGTATVTPTGGTVPYTFDWGAVGNNQNDSINTGLPPGTHPVTVTDSNACEVTVSVTITEPPVLTATISDTVHVSCNGECDGEATVTPTGGTPPYTFAWSDGQTDSIATGLCAGAYDVTVSDANSCDTIINVTITEAPVLTAVISDTVHVACNGDCTGEATVTPTGGTPPYTFAWSDGQTDSIATGLCAGTYDVTVSDANSCDTTVSVNITEPALLGASITDTVHVSSNGLCDGEAIVTPTGGTPGYTFDWGSGNGNSPNDSINTGLCAGIYNVTVTDQNDCDTVVTVEITEPPALDASITDTTHIVCGGECTGSATVTPDGGVEPYTFQWDDPANQTDSIATGLCAGFYQVTVTDDNNISAVIAVEITEPDTLIATISDTTMTSCNGACDGEATVTPSGGTP